MTHYVMESTNDAGVWKLIKTTGTLTLKHSGIMNTTLEEA